MPTLTLQDILKDEQGKRSLRDYAADLGVAHGTLAEVMNGKQPPTLAFLLKVSEKTKRDLLSLVALAYPQATEGVSATGIFFAREFDRLSEDTQKAILAIIQAARK